MARLWWLYMSGFNVIELHLKRLTLTLYVFYLKNIMSDESPPHTPCESWNLLFFSFPVEKHVPGSWGLVVPVDCPQMHLASTHRSS